MRDQFEFATTVPYEEACYPMNEDNYEFFGKLEAKALIEQIKRIHGPLPPSISLKTMACHHDFGTYYDVVLIYDDESEESHSWMIKVENGLPAYWDEEALKLLKENGYPLTTTR